MSCRLATWSILLLAVLGASGSVTALAADDAGKPAMTLIMERGDILAGQSVPITVFIENPTPAPLTELRLRFAGPPFLSIEELAADGTSCKTDNHGPEIDLSNVEAGMSTERRLCLKAGDKVDERDVSLAFSLVYKTVKNGQAIAGFLVTEKKMSVGLFGTGSVGGVSLRLAAYVVPGLLFMMILRLGGFALIAQLNGTEVGTLSVLTSVMLFILASFLPRVDFAFAGVGSSVSVALFVTLSVLAIAISLITVGIHHWRTARALRKRQALIVQVTDNDAIALEKALRGANGDFRPVTVITRDQQKFVGALMAPTNSGGVALLGWFALEVENNHPARPQLAPLFAEGNLVGALRAARTASIEPIVENPVRTLSAGGVLEMTANGVRRFLARDILESARGPVPGLAPENPLILKVP